MERYRNRLVAYSLGNLSGWRNFGTGGLASFSALLTVELGAAAARSRARSRRCGSTGSASRTATRRVGAERLMRSLSRADFGRRGVWFVPGGQLVPPPVRGLVPPPA